MRADRLLECAELALKNPRFDMYRYMHNCGVPACLLGSYEAAHPEIDIIHPYAQI